MDKILNYRFLQSTKQSAIVLLSLLVAGAFTACQKDGDGIYKPDKKLSKIFIEERFSPELVSERELIWEWDDNLLKSITINVTETLKFTFTFEYQNRRVKTIVCTDDDGWNPITSYYHFHYDGKLLSYIEGFQDTGNEEVLYRPCAKYSFSHNDRQQISEIVFEDYGMASKSFGDPLGQILPIVLPGIPLADAEKIFQTHKENSSPKSFEKIVITLTYDGDNVKEYRMEDQYCEYYYTYQYTGQSDPLYRLFSCNYTNYYWPFTSGYSRNLPSLCIGYRKQKIANLADYQYRIEYSYQLNEEGYVLSSHQIETYDRYTILNGDTIPNVDTFETNYRYEYVN